MNSDVKQLTRFLIGFRMYIEINKNIFFQHGTNFIFYTTRMPVCYISVLVHNNNIARFLLIGHNNRSVFKEYFNVGREILMCIESIRNPVPDAFFIKIVVLLTQLIIERISISKFYRLNGERNDFHIHDSICACKIHFIRIKNACYQLMIRTLIVIEIKSEIIRIRIQHFRNPAHYISRITTDRI